MAGDLALDPQLHRPAHRHPSRRRSPRDAPTRAALRLVRDLGNARRPDRPLILMGAPKWPPYPQTFAAPRVNRGAALLRVNADAVVTSIAGIDHQADGHPALQRGLVVAALQRAEADGMNAREIGAVAHQEAPH